MSYEGKYIKYKKKYLELKQKLKQNGSGNNNNSHDCDYIVIIGSFKQESNQIFVSDPSYEYITKEHEKNSKLMKLNLVINNVKPGKWKVILRIKKNEVDRNAELICIHESFFRADLKYQWEKEKHKIGIDSGQAGIYDLKYYRNDGKKSGDAWYEMNSQLSSKPTDYAGAISYGAVSSAGFGDGIYSVYVTKNDSKIVGVKIVFIS